MNELENRILKMSTKAKTAAPQDSTADSGWGWVVCVAAFTIQFVIAGQITTGGIVYTALMDEYNTKRGETGESKPKERLLVQFSMRLRIRSETCPYQILDRETVLCLHGDREAIIVVSGLLHRVPRFLASQ